MTMPKGWKLPPNLQKKAEEERERQKLRGEQQKITAQEMQRRAAEWEQRAKAEWNAIEATLTEQKKKRKRLDYYDQLRLNEAIVRREQNNYTGPIPEYLIELNTFTGPNQSAGKGVSADDALFALLVGFLIATPLTLIVGVIILNWYLLIPGLIMLGILGIIGAVAGGGRGTNAAGAYYWSSSRGRTIRMWAADKATRRRS